MKKRSDLEKFNDKWEYSETILSPHVSTPCKLWTAFKSKYGYGVFEMNNKKHQAHRAAYILLIGPIPDGMFVLHRCDVRHCVETEHFFLGTHQENMNDMINKGRKAITIGETNGRHKLPDEHIIDIRSRPVYWGSQTALANEFGVTPQQISNIINRKHRTNI